MINLLTVDLSSNQIEEFPFQTFKNCKFLVKLDISRNKIKKIDGTFKSLRNLQLLDLSSNYLKEFPVCVKECHKLKILRLIQNKIERIPAEFYKENNILDHLEELNLNSNPEFNELTSDIAKLTKLIVLGISYTKVSKLPKEIAELIHVPGQ